MSRPPKGQASLILIKKGNEIEIGFGFGWDEKTTDFLYFGSAIWGSYKTRIWIFLQM